MIRSRCARRRLPACSDARRRGLRFNEHLDNEDGPLVFAHACKRGLEGIASKRKDKSKNPNAPAVRREAEEDWSR